MFKLYYLADQSGDIYGDKCPQGVFNDLAGAQARAVIDACQHYSVEQYQGDGATFSIVYIC